jgi:hypothetical protein
MGEVADSSKGAVPLLTVAVRKALLGLEKQPDVSSLETQALGWIAPFNPMGAG